MFSGPQYKGQISNHFDGKNFVNQEETGERGLKDLLKWQRHRDPGPWFPWTPADPGPVPPQRVENGVLSVTFINHATVLLQMDGNQLLPGKALA